MGIFPLRPGHRPILSGKVGDLLLGWRPGNAESSQAEKESGEWNMMAFTQIYGYQWIGLREILTGNHRFSH